MVDFVRTMHDFLKVIHSLVFTVGTSVSVGSPWTQTQGVPKKLQRVCKNQCWAILAFYGEPLVQIPQNSGSSSRNQTQFRVTWSETGG